MGLTKQYLRYAASALFGVIGSQKANVSFVTLRGEKGRYVAVGACEHVFIWDTRKGEKVLILQGQKHEVTRLCPSPDGLSLAVGYEDGSIRIFSLLSGESGITFNGHKEAVTALSYDHLGGRLVSGSKDTHVIVWDVINESGLYRLKGHKDAVTQALFLKEKNLLVTSGKDTLVKWWDLDTQHCFQTMVGHRTEVWGMTVLSGESRVLTGSADSELRAWSLSYMKEGEDAEAPQTKKARGVSEAPAAEDGGDAEEVGGDVEEAPEQRILSCRRYGSIMREGRDRVVTLGTDRTQRFLACHGADSLLEIFCLLTEEEIAKKLEKKLKSARKKAQKKCGAGETPEEPLIERTLRDEIQKTSNIRTSSKIKSFDLLVCPKGALKVVALLQNNCVECYSLPEGPPQPTLTEGTKTYRLTIGGHRSDVRTMAFSSDNIAVLSASAEAVKIWNRSTLQCIRTMPCEYALCSAFVPGDRHVIIGSKSGKLQIFDLASGSLLESVAAHDGALWSISLSPDQRGFATGGADKCVKFWEFELISDESDAQSSRRLSVKQTRVLQLDEDVLSVRHSPDGRFVAASLLDCTVKIFFVDTLKFFLSLYGHKLPVLCLDISHDSTIIITGSADRNIKIWGLDFGDCHRSLFAHDDSVMFLQFVPKTHLFFSAGKDRKVKQWDADRFQQVQTLEGHHGEVWSLAVSPNGDHIVSSSHDKSLRLWERTREPLILEEEKELQREAEYEESVARGGQPVVAGEREGEAGLAGKKTIETIKATERIMEAVELHREESAKLEEHQALCKAAGKELPRRTHPILQAYGNISPSEYVLDVFKKVKSSELEESLLVLPFSYVPDVLTLFRDYIRRGQDVELICRCLFFLLRIHFGQITSNHMLLGVIEDLKNCTISRVSEARDVMGLNMAGLQFLKREIEAKEEVLFFADATDRFEERRRKRKKNEKLLLAVV
ncbi:WD repeat-containing protein 3 [Spea bombifrons]|uniref:WD repeat-containing protein 3 n=1 Tax=Spea bombifrons TaxID=233779 RepID=UPI00234A0881|nr:WD repeat-containing protein 3 [Spea bombifrons]XP_053312883.1 WD repeat-containing protein 3 [Spea bombifrons]